jgi:hypothetical protein
MSETHNPYDPFDDRNPKDLSKIKPKQPPPVTEIIHHPEEVFVTRNFGNDPEMVLVELWTQQYKIKKSLLEIDDTLNHILRTRITKLIDKIISALLVEVDVKEHQKYRKYLTTGELEGELETESQPLEIPAMLN